jgi:hypothetical protein
VWNEPQWLTPKSFVFWILICKLFDIYGLHAVFANMLVFTRMFIGNRENRMEGGIPVKVQVSSSQKPLGKFFFT